MEFCHFLSSYYPDTGYGAVRLYADMVEQAKLAERLGYQSVALPEHHLINILLTPAPLTMAVKVAAETRAFLEKQGPGFDPMTLVWAG